MKNLFDPKTHTYFIYGKRATGITTVISVLAKPALIQWAATEVCKFIKENAPVLEKVRGVADRWEVDSNFLEDARLAHTRKKDAAATHGTDAHALVEKYIN